MKVIVDVPNYPTECESSLVDVVQCQLETGFDSMTVDGLLPDYVDFTVKTVDESDTEDWKTKYMYLAAELENYKKSRRVQEVNMYLNNSRKVAEALLPVIDDIERSLEYEESESFKLLYNSFNSALKSLNMSKMDIKEGMSFDSDTMDAISMITTDDPNMDNMVVKVIKNGYEKDDFIVRHAQVVVSKYNT